MPNTDTHAHIFQRAGRTGAYKKPCVSFPSVPWSNTLLLWFICFLKTRGWTWLGNSLCTATVLPKSKDEHLLTLLCVPKPCFCTYTEAKAGTRNSGFPERWTAELGSTKKPEHRLKFQAPKGFSNHCLGWSPAIVQIQTQSLDSRKKLSSACADACLAHPCPPSQGFQQEHRILGQVNHEVGFLLSMPWADTRIPFCTLLKV